MFVGLYVFEKPKRHQHVAYFWFGTHVLLRRPFVCVTGIALSRLLAGGK